MMWQYHNKDNPGFTPRTMTAEQWENAYNDLKREHEALKLRYQTVCLERDNLQDSWANESPGNHGC